jgi:hypothetical protein
MGKLEADFKKIGMRNEGAPLGSKFQYLEYRGYSFYFIETLKGP